MGGHDIAGLGRACADAGDTSACVAGGRINGNSHGTGTCEQGTAHGAVCCQRDTGVQQASECEGSTLEISCPDGEKIDILAVTYGRLSSEQCTEGRGAEDNVWSRTDCDSENDLDIVRGLCQRQQQLRHSCPSGNRARRSWQQTLARTTSTASLRQNARPPPPRGIDSWQQLIV